MRVLAWDIHLFVRALVATAVFFALLVVVTATTDEGDVSAWVRLSRTLPALPVAAALGAFVPLRRARESGEERALEGLGRPPLSFVTFAVLGASVVPTAFAMVVLVAPKVDLTAFFPALQTTTRFEAGPSGFRSEGLGVDVVVREDGVVVPTFVATPPDDAARPGIASIAASPGPSKGRTPELRALAASFLVVAAWALALAAGLVRRRTAVLLGVAGAVVISGAASVVLFHMVAASRAPGVTVLVPMVLLLVGSALGYGARPWRTSNE
ncbi:MAG: hypothetical protein U0169_18025 [Polyangiaceae bacterium]